MNRVAGAESEVVSEPGPSSPAGDSFQLSVMLLIGLTISQRFIGLGRNVIFCRMLADDELGRWAVASSFLGWAAPFVVLGIPGGFGRLSEHYRQRGQLRQLLGQTSTVCLLLSVAALGIHGLFPAWVAQLIFNDPRQAPLARLLGVVLVSVTLLNFLTEFLTSVRQNRAVSLIHLTNSLLFAAAGTVLLAIFPAHERSVILAYGFSTAVAAGIGLVYTLRAWRSEPVISEPVISEPVINAWQGPSRMWQQVASLAFWIWCANTVANLFDVSDQFVLKHLSPLPASAVDAMLGQLHAARIAPALVVSLALMIGASLLPYLIHDAEIGRHQRVTERMNFVMKACALGFTLLAAITDLASPLLFGWILHGRYDSGMALMPVASVQYLWFGLAMVAGRYLICTDHPRLSILPLIVGLIANVALTSFVAPRFGLISVVWATAMANGFMLVVLLLLCQKCGMRWDRGVWLLALLPLSVSLGGAASLGITIALLVGGARRGWLMNAAETAQLLATVRLVGTRLFGTRLFGTGLRSIIDNQCTATGNTVP